VIGTIWSTINLYHSPLHFFGSWKRLYIRDFSIIKMPMIYYLINNLYLELSHQMKSLPWNYYYYYYYHKNANDILFNKQFVSWTKSSNEKASLKLLLLLLLLQLSCHLVAVVLTIVQTKQIRINIYKWNNTKNTVQTIASTENTHITKTPTRTHTHTLQNKLKQPQYKIHINEIVTIQSSTLSIRSLQCTWYFCPQELHHNSLHFI